MHMAAFLIGLYKHIYDCLKVQKKGLILEYFPNFYSDFSTFVLFLGKKRGTGKSSSQFSDL